MAEYGDLLKLLKGEQDQEEPMMSVGEPASISGINEQAKSPYQQEAPEITPEQVLDMPKMQQDIADYSSDLNKSAKEAKLKDTYGAIPDEPELSAQEKLIKELRSIQENKSKEAKTAQEEANKRALLANAIKALGTIGQAQIQRSAGIPIGLKAAEMTASKDVSSPILKERDAMLKQMMDEYKMLNKPKDQLSAKDQAYLDYYQKRLEATQQSQKKASEREERISRKQQLDSARSLIKDDPRTKKAYEQAMALEDIQPLVQEVKSGNQNAAAALGTRLARAMGEVGVLTDADVTRYVQGTSWGRKLQDWAKKGYDGAPSQETLNEIIKNADTISKKLQGNLKNVYKNAESRMKTAYPDLDESTIKGLLGTAKFEEESQPVPQKIRIEVNGKIGTVPQDKVEALLKKYPNAKILE